MVTHGQLMPLPQRWHCCHAVPQLLAQESSSSIPAPCMVPGAKLQPPPTRGHWGQWGQPGATLLQHTACLPAMPVPCLPAINNSVVEVTAVSLSPGTASLQGRVTTKHRVPWGVMASATWRPMHRTGRGGGDGGTRSKQGTSTESKTGQQETSPASSKQGGQLSPVLMAGPLPVPGLCCLVSPPWPDGGGSCGSESPPSPRR